MDAVTTRCMAATTSPLSQTLRYRPGSDCPAPRPRPPGSTSDGVAVTEISSERLPRSSPYRCAASCSVSGQS